MGNPKDLAWPVPKTFFVYIMSNDTRMLYIGVTNNLERRVLEHRQKVLHSYTSRYNLTWLIYYVEFDDINAAIAREKQLKGWRRPRKIDLVHSTSPRWRDLAREWA